MLVLTPRGQLYEAGMASSMSGTLAEKVWQCLVTGVLQSRRVAILILAIFDVKLIPISAFMKYSWLVSGMKDGVSEISVHHGNLMS